MSVSGSWMSDVLPWQPGENVYTIAYFCANELALQSERTSAAHVFCRTIGSGQSIHGVSPAFQN